MASLADKNQLEKNNTLTPAGKSRVETMAGRMNSESEWQDASNMRERIQYIKANASGRLL